MEFIPGIGQSFSQEALVGNAGGLGEAVQGFSGLHQARTGSERFDYQRPLLYRPSMSGFDYFATGPRMAFRVPLGLESAGLLTSLHIDAYASPGPQADLATRLLGPRVASRVLTGIDLEKVHRHTEIFLLARVRRRLLLAGRDTARVDDLLIRQFRRIAKRCKSPAVFGMQSSSLELFVGRETRIMEQFSPPLSIERSIAEDELRWFKGWAPPGVSRRTPWEDRMVEEWEAANLVWVPSAHLIPLCERCGANQTKFRVLRYPMEVAASDPPRLPRRRGHLRVVFAGTLMLAKGVQYIYEALRGWSRRIDMHFFGPVQLTPFGVARLAEVGTVHGPVPRPVLMSEFAQSDVLLFPSLSEGSALVTAEAAGVGLPIIATRDSGCPDAAVLVEPRNATAIRGALERLLDEPHRLETHSRACLAEARFHTVENFNRALRMLACDAFVGSRAIEAGI